MEKVKAIDQVLEIINSIPECDTKTITEKVDYSKDTVRKACAKLVEEGKIIRKEIKLSGALKKFLFSKVEEKTSSRNDIIEKAKNAAKISSEERNRKVPKNRDRVTFKGEELGKAKLVKAVILSFVENNSNLKYDEISKILNFDNAGRRLYPKYDVIRKVSDKQVQKSFNSKQKRYYIKDILKSSDNIEFVICREWGMDNIDKNFIIPIAIDKMNISIDTFSK